MTNGDRIRQMSNEDLYDEILYATGCEYCDFLRECRKLYNSEKGRSLDSVCREMWMKWLNEEEE